MKTLFMAVTIATIAACPLPQSARADTTPQPAEQPAVFDIALDQQGAMIGQVVDPQGAGLAERPVVLFEGDRQITQTTTNTEGYFRVASLRGGIYQVVAGDRTVVARAWPAGTAPPVAQRGMLLVAGGDVYRGQQSGGFSMMRFLGNPITITAAVATAVAVPVAVHNSRRSPASP